MRGILLLLSMAFISSIIYAQTEVSGEQTGAWTAADSPYLVVGDINVPSGEGLYIEEGVEVRFQGYYKLQIDGLLHAMGHPVDSILFTAEDIDLGWKGIRFNGTSGMNHLEYCRIEYGRTEGEYPDIHGAAIALFSANVEAISCTFADNDATGDEYGMGGAIYGYNTMNSIFSDCDFLRNHSYGEGGAVKLTGDYGTTFYRCNFIGNNCFYGGGALSFYMVSNTKLKKCLIADNYTTYSAGGAIQTLGIGNTFTLENCTLSDNEAVNGDGGAINLASATATITNCIVYQNEGAYSDDINLDMDGNAIINYSCLTMPAGASGGNNIDTDPLFVDAVNGDFHLQETSACIDAGMDIGMQFIGEAPDMGCFEYDPGVATNTMITDNHQLYPNPAKDYFSIQNLEDIEAIYLSDITGKTIKIISEFQQERFDISDLKTGIYFVNIITQNQSQYTYKLIVE